MAHHQLHSAVELLYGCQGAEVVWLSGGRGCLVVRGQRFAEVVTRGQAVMLRLKLLSGVWAERESPLEAEVKQLTRGKSQRHLSRQSPESVAPSVQHGSAHRGGAVGGAPEDLWSQNLKSTEVESAILKDIKFENINDTHRKYNTLFTMALCTSNLLCHQLVGATV